MGGVVVDADGDGEATMRDAVIGAVGLNIGAKGVKTLYKAIKKP